MKLADTNRYQFLALSSLSGYTNSTKEVSEWCIISFVTGTDQGGDDGQQPAGVKILPGLNKRTHRNLFSSLLEGSQYKPLLPCKATQQTMTL